MNWKKLKNLMREQPQYFDDSIQLSAAETTRIMKAHPYSFEDIIRDAKRKAGLPVEAWAAADRVIARNAKRRKSKSPVVFHRRLAVAMAVIVLLVGFFTLTPVGRAIAESVIDYIVRFFDNSVLFESDGDSGALVPDIPLEQLPDSLPQPVEEMRVFQTIEELKNETGFNPVYLCTEYAKLENVSLFVDNVLEEKSTNILYSFPQGYVSLVQFWTVNSSTVFQTGKQLESIMVLENHELILYEDEYDHTITGFIIFYDSTLMITVAAGIDIKEIASFLCSD